MADINDVAMQLLIGENKALKAENELLKASIMVEKMTSYRQGFEVSSEGYNAEHGADIDDIMSEYAGALLND